MFSFNSFFVIKPGSDNKCQGAKETGCKTLVTPCPFCKLNLENDDIEVVDLTEFLVKYGGVNGEQ